MVYNYPQLGWRVDSALLGSGTQTVPFIMYPSAHFYFVTYHTIGVIVLRRLRTHQCTTPVLILSARDADDERVQGLDAGADDYLVKPFSINELVARVRALLRRSGGARSQQVRHARLAFDTVSRTVTIDDDVVDLSSREVSLLEAVFVHFGQVVSKERLLEQVYGYEGDVGLNTIEVYIHRLRKKIAGSGVALRTIHGRGYRLEVEDIPASDPHAGELARSLRPSGG